VKPRWSVFLFGGALALLTPLTSRAEDATVGWCAPELEVIEEGICYAPADSAASSRHLVIFLHSLVGANSSWQWEQQRMVARAAKLHGASVLFPRGRLGIGPGRAPNIWAWPTSAGMQKEHEAALIEEWLSAKRRIEARERAFERVFVFGFSNGAYYATSLALRARIEIDGYGVFAGGSGSKYLRLLAAPEPERAPIYIGYGTKDPAHGDQRKLVKLLKSLGWRHRSRAERVGHTATARQLSEALRFLSDAEPREAAK
jgi:predicted esterase